MLIATIINGFIEHVWLVRQGSDLPFQDIYTAVTELVPVAWFSIASATVWFADISLIILWIRIDHWNSDYSNACGDGRPVYCPK